MIDPAIKTRIESLNPAYMKLVGSTFTFDISRSIAKANNFTEPQTVSLSNAIMLYLLIFLTFEELIDFITTECKIKKEEATKIANTLLTSLPPDFKINHDKTYQALHHPAEEKGDLVSDIAETEANLKSIPRIRTMAEDMQANHAGNKKEITYTTTQEAILKEGRLGQK